MNSHPHLASASLPILFGDRGCPFAHRVRALLEHLGLALDLREAAIGEMPEGIDDYTQRKRIPLLVHDELVLGESRVMLEYLAEWSGFDEAYPADPRQRAAHRYAMALVDDTLVPLLMGRVSMPNDSTSLDETLEVLQRATALVPPHANLLALHIAPLWRAFQLWHPGCVVIRAIEARPELLRWLDTATNLPCVSNTATSVETLQEDMEHARGAGLLPNLA